ncbi:Protein_tyrosine phosphatase [Hexamita inflata]|uniref:Protein tyrosine phosphatase n=1 Tax=Hexamita inflata TaxID=28002 RepID=A0AA86R0H7_9EUKA|nr:Protein tyrosine phosphatase [Hexamita inflata]
MSQYKQTNDDGIENIPKRLQDPGFNTVEEYLQYFDTKMAQEAMKRQQFVQSTHTQENVLNPYKNRYSDILPYAHSQPTNNYFNGNYVSLCGIKFLVSQAPIDILQFHDLVWECDVSHIVQVSPFVENGFSKVSRYVPLCNEESSDFTRESIQAAYAQECYIQQKRLDPNAFDVRKLPFFKNTLVTENSLQVESSSFVDYQYFIKMSLEYKSQISKSKYIQYIYYKNWADQSAPSNFQHVFDVCSILDIEKTILVHCSAGIGRSATLIICLAITKQMKERKTEWKQLNPSIFNMVEEMRLNRNPNCIQTRQQFKFLFDFAEWCGKN